MEVDIPGLFDAVQEAGTIAGGVAYADLISDRGQQYANQMGQLAATLQNDAKFTGYGVKTGLGSSTVDAQGGFETSVGRDPLLQSSTGKYHHGNLQMQNAYDMLSQGASNPYAQQAANMMMQGYGQMGGAFDNVAGREQDIYNRAMAMQQPQLDAARAQSNAQEFAAGRGGVMGSQFGGTGEDAAMARAQARAQNAAAFQAMGQAQQEAMNQAAIGNQMFGAGAGYNQAGLGNAQLGQAAAGQLGSLGAQQAGLGLQAYGQSYLPLQNQLNAMQVAQNSANMAQTGQLTGTGYGAQLGLGGIQTAVNADKSASELIGNIIASQLGAAGAGGSGEPGFFSKIAGAFKL